MLGVKFALGVTSGTTALYTAMAALEIGPGDEVILPAWTWYADYDAIVLSGALPVFAEIDESFDIDPKDIEQRITPRTKAIIACHLQGCPADMDPIMEIARKHKIRVVEDCAQCAGGRYKGKYVGTIGDIGHQQLPAQQDDHRRRGRGGHHERSRSCSSAPSASTTSASCDRPTQRQLNGGLLAAFAACNFRMNEFTGAVLKGQLPKLETICQRVRANARKVREGIADLPGLKLRKTPDIEGDIGRGVFPGLWHSNERRDKFLRAMRAEGIGASGPGGRPSCRPTSGSRRRSRSIPNGRRSTAPRARRSGTARECCPRTIDILDRAGGVMMDPNFTDDDVKDIVKAIRKVYPAIMKG